MQSLHIHTKAHCFECKTRKYSAGPMDLELQCLTEFLLSYDMGITLLIPTADDLLSNYLKEAVKLSP